MKTLKEIQKDIGLVKTSSQAQHSKIKEILKNLSDHLIRLEESFNSIPTSKISPELAKLIKKEEPSNDTE